MILSYQESICILMEDILSVSYVSEKLTFSFCLHPHKQDTASRLIHNSIFIFISNSRYIKSLVSALYTDRTANTKDIKVRITGKTRLFFIVKSPIFACVKKISRKDEIIVAFEDFIARPMNRAIKLMLTITTDFRISCT